MSATRLFTLILLILPNRLWSYSLPNFRCNSIIQRGKLLGCSSNLFNSATGNEVDISPQKDNSILKTLLREGSLVRSSPIAGDSVEVKYKMIDFATGDVLHDSSHGPKNGETKEGVYPIEGEETKAEKAVRVVNNLRSLTFKVGTEPLQALPGWDIAVRTMRHGEISSFVMAPEMAFGAKGAPPLVAPNAKLTFELELLQITPDWTLEFETSEEEGGVKAKLIKDLESGESPLSQAVYGKQKSGRSFGSGVDRPREHPDLNGEIVPDSIHSKSSPEGTAATASASNTDSFATPKFHIKTPHIRVSEPPPPEQRIRPDGTVREFYDPDRHQLDTTTEVSGQAPGYQWKETFSTMDVEIPLKLGEDAKQAVRFGKADLLVDVTTSVMNVRHRDGRPLLVGPLHGKINPNEVSWALADYGIADTYKHKAFQCLQISLEKGVLYRDIWGSVLNKEFVSAQLTPEERAARRAEFDLYNRPPPPKPPAEPTTQLMEGEEMEYVDYDVDEEGNLIGQSTGSGTGEDLTHFN